MPTTVQLQVLTAAPLEDGQSTLRFLTSVRQFNDVPEPCAPLPEVVLGECSDEWLAWARLVAAAGLELPGVSGLRTVRVGAYSNRFRVLGHVTGHSSGVDKLRRIASAAGLIDEYGTVQLGRSA